MQAFMQLSDSYKAGNAADLLDGVVLKSRDIVTILQDTSDSYKVNVASSVLKFLTESLTSRDCLTILLDTSDSYKCNVANVLLKRCECFSGSDAVKLLLDTSDSYKTNVLYTLFSSAKVQMTPAQKQEILSDVSGSYTSNVASVFRQYKNQVVEMGPQRQQAKPQGVDAKDNQKRQLEHEVKLPANHYVQIGSDLLVDLENLPDGESIDVSPTCTILREAKDAIALQFTGAPQAAVAVDGSCIRRFHVIQPTPPKAAVVPATEPEQDVKGKVEVKPDDECVVCNDKKRQIAFAPCGHLACCAACADKLSKCPLCQAVVTSRLRVFM